MAWEAFGPPVTKTDVQLSSSSVSVFSGEGSLNNLYIGNPKGYKAPGAFDIGMLKVALDLESVTSDTLVIKSIDIVNPDITYELGGSAGSNLQQLVRNVQSGGSGGGEGDTKVVIDRLTIRDGHINIVTPLSEDGISAPLPTIELTDIGKKKGGVLAADVVKLVMQKVTRQVVKASAGPLSDVKGQLGEQAKGLTKGASEKAGGVGDKLKGLFGN